MAANRFSIARPGMLAAFVASVACFGVPAYAALPTAARASLVFLRVPSRDRLVAIAWEDLTEPALSLTVPAPVTVVTVATARAETLLGPAELPGGRGWFMGTPGDMAGTRGQVVFEFRGPDGQVLCAASPVLRVPSSGSWHALPVPAFLVHSTVTLPNYTWIWSRDGRWSREDPKIAVYPTPEARGYTLSFRYVPLDWQLAVLQFAGPGLRLETHGMQTLADGGVNPFFSLSSLGWSFVYPVRDVGRRGWIEAKFTWGKHASTWLRSTEFRLRG